MSRRKRKQSTPNHLIARRVLDTNFAHVVRMFPLLRMWAAAIEEGQRIDFNDRNMVQMPVEIAEAFIRYYANQDDELGRVCCDVIASIDGNIPELPFMEIVEPTSIESLIDD